VTTDAVTAIVTSDWHADAVTAGLGRYEDVEAAAEEISDAAKGCQLFCFLGDLSDPNNIRSHRAVALACRVAIKLNAMGVISLWLTGNHDVIDDGEGTHTLSALKAMGSAQGLKSVHVLDHPTAGLIPNVDLGTEFVALPFTSRTAPYDADAFIRDFAARRSTQAPPVILSHLSAPLLRIGSESAAFAKGRDFALPIDAIVECLPGALVLQGHYHKRQRAELGGGVEVHVPGSPERLRFDEADHVPGYLKVSWPRGAS
jgi:DNA repair exonuclease SbcCD nuclease subunit